MSFNFQKDLPELDIDKANYIKLQIKDAINNARSNGMSKKLCFHGEDHGTFVRQQALLIANNLKLSIRAKQIIGYFAQGHDIYVRSHNAEEKSAQEVLNIINKTSPNFYSDEELRTGYNAIVATKMIKSNDTISQQFDHILPNQILRDADLSHLACLTELEFRKWQNLYLEEEKNLEPLTFCKVTELEKSLKFMENHKYQTPKLKNKLELLKKKNILVIKQMIIEAQKEISIGAPI